jgi:hypothetical protein
MATKRSIFDPYIGQTIFYPGCDVNIVAGRQYEISFVDTKTPHVADFVARRYVNFKHDRHWIVDPCCPHAERHMFMWVSEILDQVGDKIVIGMPWNYDKFWDNEQLMVAA